MEALHTPGLDGWWRGLSLRENMVRVVALLLFTGILIHGALIILERL